MLRVVLFLAIASTALAACGGDNNSGGDGAVGGHAICDTTSSGLCTAYSSGSTAAMSVCSSAGGTYVASGTCTSTNRVGTCACGDVGQGQGAATLHMYSPTYTCAAAKAACAGACNGAAGTFSGGC